LSFDISSLRFSTRSPKFRYGQFTHTPVSTNGNGKDLQMKDNFNRNCPPDNLAPYSNANLSLSDFAQGLLSAIPMALASPILDYQKVKEQSRLLELAINAQTKNRADIMSTIRALAADGQLSSDKFQTLMAAYVLPPTIN